MDFELNETQRQLQASVQRVFADQGSFEHRRKSAHSGSAHDPTLFATLADLGVTALLIPEADGGLGGRLEDLWPVLLAQGNALSLEPILASAVLGTLALAWSDNVQLKSTVLPGLMQGSTLLAWAHDEPASPHAAWWIEAQARQEGNTWRLTGCKSPVLHGSLAHHWVISARVHGTPGQDDGCALFLVDATANGVTRRDFRWVDDSAACELQLRDVEAQPLSQSPANRSASQTIQRISTVGMAALCVEMLGAMEAAHRLAIDYVNIRKQFGRPIGQNQALRHRVAEMQVAVEMCRSAAMAAVVAADRLDNPDSLKEVMQAKLIVGRYARQVCEAAIQCHGGIGMTEEYAVGHYLRRVHVADHLFGDSKVQAHRLATLS